MEKKVKFLSLLILLLTIILMILIRMDYPLNISTTKSVFHMIPLYNWILLLAIPFLISATFLLSKSKIIIMFLTMVYFLVLYSYYLFFVIPPAGADMVEGGQMFYNLKDTMFLSVEQFDYFQWPIHFLLYSMFLKLLGSNLSALTVMLFSYILMIPIFFYLFINKRSDRRVIFLLPISYIILSNILINLQLVPQFTGLIFLFLTIGCYIKYDETGLKKFYASTLLFYTLCVFTHPFIFIFFPAAIILDNYFLPKKIIKTKNNYTSINFLILLSIIYLTGYMYRFTKMSIFTRRLVFGTSEIVGEAWEVIAYLLGSKQEVGLIDYEVFPLFEQVSESVYLISRYSVLILLILFGLLLIYVFFKNLSKIKPFDISLGIAGGGFFLLGLINPVLLGQRAFQVLFIRFPRHFTTLFKSNKKILALLLVSLIVMSPFLFTTNKLINQGLTGERFIQDIPTLTSGRFVMNFVKTESNLLTADFSFYPGRNNEQYTFEIYRTRSIPKRIINLSEIDIVIDSPKQINTMKYYGIVPDFHEYVRLYDEGNSQILINND